jgi:adenosylcobinamide-phosphate synthase
MKTALIATAAIAIDWLFAEPRRWHPLAAFGWLASRTERRLFAPRRARGALAAALLVLPLVFLVWTLETLPDGYGAMASAIFLYLAIGHRSLHDHALRVLDALGARRPGEARFHASRMVSRDPEALEPKASTIESVLENGSDAVFATLFWFAAGGAAGAVAHRLINTLDAMWGYRNERYEAFGWAAARLDDAMNWAPARLAALTYAVLGRTRQALRCWRTQARQWESPNAGPVMAAGAGALGVTLGGPARYGGSWRDRPVLGAGPAPGPADIARALRLVRRGVILWLCVFAVAGAANA